MTPRKANSNQKRKDDHVKELKHELEKKKHEIFLLESSLEDTNLKKLHFEREIRRLEEKNKDLTQKVLDLKEDMEEADVQRAQEKKTMVKLREQLKVEQESVSRFEGEVFKLQMDIDEMKSHDKILLKERDQYSDSKFALEGKIRQLETRLNDQRREYIEIVSIKEELEETIEQITEEKRILIRKSSENKVDFALIRKFLHLAGLCIYFFILKLCWFLN